MMSAAVPWRSVMPSMITMAPKVTLPLIAFGAAMS